MTELFAFGIGHATLQSRAARCSKSTFRRRASSPRPRPRARFDAHLKHGRQQRVAEQSARIADALADAGAAVQRAVALVLAEIDKPLTGARARTRRAIRARPPRRTSNCSCCRTASRCRTR